MTKILFFIFISISAMQAQSNSKLIYIGDPMCSWCYGISEDLKSVWESNKNIDRALIVGGLRPGGGDAWDDTFKNFLRHHWEDVAKASGADFSYDLLDTDDFLYDTEPSCRAIVVVRELSEENAFSFFKSVQRKFYFENKDPKDIMFYESICKTHNIDFDIFSQKFLDPSYKTTTAKDFMEARKLGISSFPTLLLQHNGIDHIVAKGYATASEMQKTIDRILSK